MNRDERDVRANRAKQLLDNDLFKGSFETLESEVLNKLKTANLDGSEQSQKYVEALARHLQVIEGVQRMLSQTVEFASMNKRDTTIGESLDRSRLVPKKRLFG